MREDRCKNCIRRLFGVRGLKKRGRGASGGFNIKGWDACPMNPTRKVKQLCFTHHHNSLWGDNTQSQTNISLFYLPIILILKCDCRRLEWYWRVILLKHHLAKSPFQLIKLKSVTSSFLWSFTLRSEKTNNNWPVFMNLFDLQNLNLAKMFIRVEVQINFQSSNFIHGLYFLWSCPSLK